jgi:hypothetical protein
MPPEGQDEPVDSSPVDLEAFLLSLSREDTLIIVKETARNLSSLHSLPCFH